MAANDVTTSSDSNPLRKVAGSVVAVPVAFGRAFGWVFEILTKSNAIYSLKTFAAGMLALYISLRLNLSQPGWALMTVYIVSQPLAGMVLSKSLARAGGTVIGAIMSVVLVSAFGGLQELFVPAMAIWVGACLYVSIWLRDTPASYAAMLSGYTAAMIGFSAVLSPDSTFTIATERCLAILLGITMATLASRLVFPRSTVRVFRMRAAATLADMQERIVVTLGEHYDDAKGLAALRKLIADSVALESLRIHATRDTDSSRLDANVVRVLQGRLLSLSSLLVSIHDRVVVLRRERPREAAALEPLFARVIERVNALAGDGAGVAGGGSLTAALLERLPDFEAMRRDPELVVEYNIILRLIDLLAQWQEINRLRVFLFSDAPGKSAAKANIPVPPEEDLRIVRFRDHSLALVAAVGAACAVVCASGFWIWSGWSHGYAAAIFAAVGSCLMAVQDNPARGAMQFLLASVGSVALASVLMLFVLPNLSGFPGLVLGLGLFAVPLGMLVPVPRFAMLVTTLLLNNIAFLSLKGSMSTDYAEFLNSTIGLLVGLLFPIAAFLLLRPVGTEWPIRRLTAGMMRDLAQLAASDDPERRAHFESRMLDRVSAMTLRLRMDNVADREHFQGSLTVVRVGLNNLVLLRQLPDMPPRLAVAVRTALDTLAEHCRQRASSAAPSPATSPVAALDTAINATLEAGSASHAGALDTLVSLRAIRATLTQHAAFYGIQ